MFRSSSAPLRDDSEGVQFQSREKSRISFANPTVQKHINYWKRMVFARQEPQIKHYSKNFWPRKLDYYIYTVLLGNGVDGLPLSFRLALDISGGFFLLLLLLFTFILAMPMMYMEIFLGKYTKLSNSQLYRMGPIFFGYCILTFTLALIYVPMQSGDVGLFLIAALKIAINGNYMEDCPPNSTGCYNFRTHGRIFNNCTLENGELKCWDDRPSIRYVAAYIYWKSFVDLAEYYSMWEPGVANIITWLFITLFCMLGMRFLGMFLKAAFVINISFNTIIFIMAITTKGATTGLRNLVEFTMQQVDIHQTSIMAFYSILKIGVMSSTGYMTFAAYNSKSNSGPGSECLIICVFNMGLCIYYLIIMHTIAGVIAEQMGIQPHQVSIQFAGLYYAMIPEYLKFRKVPSIFIITFHISNWLIEIAKFSINLHMTTMNLFDFLPRVSNYQSYAILGLGITCSILSGVTSLELFLKVLKPVMWCIRVEYTEGFRLLIASLMVFYCYGVSRLNDDIHFVTGRRPIKYWRIIWYIYPIVVILCLSSNIVSQWNKPPHSVTGMAVDIPPHWIRSHLLYAGIFVCACFSFIIFISTFFYIVIGIRSSNTIMNLLKPQFFWGPPKKASRIARKSFAPRRSIRSQPQKKKKQRFRPHSIKQMHERDKADHVTRGRIFLDSIFFSSLNKYKHERSGYKISKVRRSVREID